MNTINRSTKILSFLAIFTLMLTVFACDQETTAPIIQPVGSLPLVGLAVSQGITEPFFSPNVRDYLLHVEENVDELYIMPILIAGIGSYELRKNNQIVSNPVILDYGQNNIVIEASVDGGLTKYTYTLQVFRGLSENFAELQISGLTLNEKVFILSGPGYTIERFLGYNAGGVTDYTIGTETENSLVYETSGADADMFKGVFDTYATNQSGFSSTNGSLTVRDGLNNVVMIWKFTDFRPKEYKAGLSGRTRFTWASAGNGNKKAGWEIQQAITYGDNSYDPNEDIRIEIEGVDGPVYVKSKIDYSDNHFSAEFGYWESKGTVMPYMMAAIVTESSFAKKPISRIGYSINPYDGPTQNVEVRTNYYGCFPISYKILHGFGNANKMKIQVKYSFDYWQKP